MRQTNSCPPSRRGLTGGGKLPFPHAGGRGLEAAPLVGSRWERAAWGRGERVEQCALGRSSLMLSFRIAIWLSVFWAGLAWAQIYKWTDAQGTVHLTDNPSRIPPEYRSRVAVEHVTAPAPPANPSNEATATPTDPAAPGEPPSPAPQRDRLGRGSDYWRALPAAGPPGAWL